MYWAEDIPLFIDFYFTIELIIFVQYTLVNITNTITTITM